MIHAVMVYAVLTVRLVLAGVFLVSFLTKLRTRRAFGEFTTAVRRLGGLPTPLVAPAAVVVVAAEAGTVVLLAAPGLDGDATAGLVLAGALLLGFAVILARALRRGAAGPCRCFGGSDEPIGLRDVARNGVLVACAAAGVVMTYAGAGASAGSGAAVPPAAAALCLLGASVVVGAVVFLDDLLDLLR
ncbi:MauE/DoxX family redox-associated membrane protein [Microbispora triticiradicis]|uniref:MauE/DoxX family redox-associated membrane protein n=1 Tax=Microbispora triticiradicis TaxID=2200763 RepID=UPI001AD7A337|nr:MauE/DoxX family redox-associated membrane protein [Microbispora triticiradicis]MBO4270636.1 methylamine utilization protein MauE [Microbispora triticiradicis]